jgi:hypothetical protein
VLQHRFFSACVSLAGAVLLSFITGAAVMFYQLPSCELLGKAFIGGYAWRSSDRTRQTRLEVASTRPSSRPKVDRPGETFDGLTLFAYGAHAKPQGTASEAWLIDMEGRPVHRWSIPFSRVFPVAPHLPSRPPDSFVCLFDCRLFPNGDLLVVFHSATVAGCGLAKVDKDSNLIWAHAAQVHHDVDVGEDGVIYAIQHDSVFEVPGYPRIVGPSNVDSVVMLSPDGELLREPISLLSAFQGTPYAPLLATLEQESVASRQIPPEGSTAPRIDYQLISHEPLHANCVRVLNADIAPKFPMFKPGQVLVSLRNVSIIAMLDPQAGKIVWAARGPWYAQHDAQFLQNGHLLLFDNMGIPQGSRVLEYDPQTQALPWSYAGEGGAPFYTSERGMCQRLPNGNTLIVSSEQRQLLEVTHGKKVVWSCSLDGYVATARRYSPDQLSFLDEDHRRARP